MEIKNLVSIVQDCTLTGSFSVSTFLFCPHDFYIKDAGQSEWSPSRRRSEWKLTLNIQSKNLLVDVSVNM